MQPQGAVPCVAVLCKHNGCCRAAAGASSAGMQMAALGCCSGLRLLPCLLRGVRAPGLFREPGAVSWHPERSRAALLCAGAERAVGPRGWSRLCGGPGDLDSVLAALNPAERRGGFMKAEGGHAHVEMPDIKPAFMHGVSRGIGGAWWHAEGRVGPEDRRACSGVYPRTDSRHPRTQTAAVVVCRHVDGMCVLTCMVHVCSWQGHRMVGEMHLFLLMTARSSF